MEYALLFIDGHCVLCNKFAVWMAPKVCGNQLRIAALQDAAFIKSQQLQLPSGTKSLVYVNRHGEVYTYSDAALAVAQHLQAPYPRIANIIRFVPKFLRDAVYKIIAKTRYRFFGKKESCNLPGKALKNLEIGSHKPS